MPICDQKGLGWVGLGLEFLDDGSYTKAQCKQLSCRREMSQGG